MPFSSKLGFFRQRRSLLAIIPPANTPTYAITTAGDVVGVGEGASVTFNITTTGVANNTTLYWTLQSATVTAADFTPAASNGMIVIQNNSATFTLTTLSDNIAEGSEFFSIALRTGSVSGPVVATSASISITDPNQTITYAVTPAASSVNEGSSLTFNVATTGVANATVLYWRLNFPTDVAKPASSADFAVLNGTVTINSNAGSFSVTPVADNLTEGPELFSVTIRTGSANGTIVATSSTVTINDTSITPAPAMTASMVMVDSYGNKYNVNSSSYHAGLKDFSNVFNLGDTATTLRKISYFDLTLTNGTFGPITGGTVLASSLGGMYFYKTVPGPDGSVQFVPSNNDYTIGTIKATFWIYVTQLSYDATTKKGVYRIWEKQSKLSSTSDMTSATTAADLLMLKSSDPVWPHHPTKNVPNFTSAETAAWYTLFLPGSQLKFVWRVKATNQA